MAINNDIYFSSNLLQTPTFSNSAKSSAGSDSFGSILDQQTERQAFAEMIQSGGTRSSKSIQELLEIFQEKGFKGFFKAIEEEKIKKLREEILAEMGLTEEKLSELPPQQRAKIEETISDEIKKRMAIGSLEDEDTDNIFNNQENIPVASPASGLDESAASLSFLNINALLNSDENNTDE